MKGGFIRAFCMILSLFLLFSICGCGNKPIDEEIIYEYEYESGIVNPSNNESNYESGGSDVDTNNNPSPQNPNTNNSSSTGQAVTPTTSTPTGSNGTSSNSGTSNGNAVLADSYGITK